MIPAAQRFLSLRSASTLVLTLSLILAVIMGFDLIPFLRGDEIFHWQWTYDPVALSRALGFAVGLAVYLLGLFALNGRRAGLVWALIGAVALSLLAVWAREGDPFLALYTRTVSLTATGPYTIAGMIDWASPGWHDWAHMMIDMRELSNHVAISPPGLPLFYAGLARLIDAVPPLANFLRDLFLPLQCQNTTLLTFTAGEWGAALFGVLMPLWSGLTVFPLYAVVRKLRSAKSLDTSPDTSPESAQTTAVWIAGLWALIPAVMLFAASWNTFYPLMAITAFWLLLRGLDAPRENHNRTPRMASLQYIGGRDSILAVREKLIQIAWLIGSGLLIGLLIFANLSVVPLLSVFGFYIAFRIFSTEANTPMARRIYRIITAGLALTVGIILPWTVYVYGTGQAFTQILQVAFDRHFTLDRPYLPWIWMHFWEWMLLGGFPLVLGWLISWRRRGVQQRDALSWALLLTLVLLLLSGTARGETGRVWLFFIPFVLVALSAAGSSSVEGDANQWDWRKIAIAQAALTLVLVITWTGIVVPDVHPPEATPPITANATPIDADFAPGFRLTGWSGEVGDGAIYLRLNWQSEANITVPYFFAALPVAPDGTVGASVVWQPDVTRYPTTCWRLGQAVGDEIVLPLPEGAPTEGWYVSLTAFADVDTPMDRLSVTLADGTVDQQVGLGPISYR